MVVRKMLDLVFSQHDLAWLDDILPEKDKKKKEDEKKKKEKKKAKADEHNNSDEEVKTNRCVRCYHADTLINTENILCFVI